MSVVHCESAQRSPICKRKSQFSTSAVFPTYQQQISSQAKSLGLLRRHFIARKCFEEKIDERKVLMEIQEYKSCFPSANEMQILKQLIKNKACPEAIIYQTYVVESMKAISDECIQSNEAEETCRKLNETRPPEKTCEPTTPSCRQPNMTLHSSRTPPPRTPRQPFSRAPSPKTPTTVVRQQICTSFATPPPCPGGPRPVSTMSPLNPCPKQQNIPCGRSSLPRNATSNTRQRKTPVFFRTPGQTPMTKRRTNIPLPVPDILRTQKRRIRDLSGTKIPCPISSQEGTRPRFSRPRDVSMRSDKSSQASKRRISFGDTQLSYFEDTMPALIGSSALEPTIRNRLLDDTCYAPEPAHVFKEFKSMIDEEKKEIQEMHNVVTQLLDRSEKVDFRDMYTLVPSISYIDETLTETVPEVAAAMLHSDELGLNMKSPPNKVYNTLFKEGEKDKTLIKVEAEENAKNVVPVSSDGFQASLLGYEQKGLFDDLYEHEEYKMPEMPQPKKQAREQGKDDNEILSSTMKDEQLEEKISGLTQVSSIHSNYGQESSQFNVQLIPDHHTKCDYLQIRGSQPPTWFPGYYVAMGDNNKVNVISKPWDVIEKAWRKFLPANMKPDTGAYVLGI